ncbi:hypothetical protein ACFRFU_50110 [Streptomyces sp. NPDC056704]|uniref:hypothetical protein n=1 Tax=Streptomyces TaxID=1883 RepID=UPI0036A280A3
MIFNSLSAQALADLVIALRASREPGVHFRWRTSGNPFRRIDPRRRRIVVRSGPPIRIGRRIRALHPRSGTVKELVRAVMVDGITDPAVVLAEVRAGKPDASGETVERMVRLYRVTGSG